MLDGLEPGFDCFFSPSQGFVKPYLWGWESAHAYIGVVSDSLPEPLSLIADKLAPYLASIDYRGAISTEALITKDGTPYVIDYTCRMPFPLSLAYTELYSNYSDIILSVAQDKKITAKTTAPFVACLPLSSEYAKDNWLQINIDPKQRRWIKTLDSCMAAGDIFSVRGPTNIVNLVAVGDSVPDLSKRISGLLDHVHAHGLEGKAALGSLQNIEGIISEGEKAGLKFRPQSFIVGKPG